jgi:hypothetical protein
MHEIEESRVGYLLTRFVTKKCAFALRELNRYFGRPDESEWRMLAEYRPTVAADLSLAILASILNAARFHSPAFDGRRDLAERIEFWALFSLISDFAEEYAQTPRELLSRVRYFQSVDRAAFESLQPPFPHLTRELLTKWLGADVSAICLPGAKDVNPLLLTFLSDVVMLTVGECFMAYRKLVDEYSLIQSPLPPDWSDAGQDA